VIDCERCGATNDGSTRFCYACGKLLDKEGLRRVRLMGAVGIWENRHTNPKIDEFFSTGDPDVFDKP
jgi:hypothetical protein